MNTTAMIAITSSRTSVQRLAMPLHWSSAVRRAVTCCSSAFSCARCLFSAKRGNSDIVNCPEMNFRPKVVIPAPLRQCFPRALRQSSSSTGRVSPVIARRHRGLPGARHAKTVIAGLDPAIHRDGGDRSCGKLGLLPPPLWGRGGEGGSCCCASCVRQQLPPPPTPPHQCGLAGADTRVAVAGEGAHRMRWRCALPRHRTAISPAIPVK